MRYSEIIAERLLSEQAFNLRDVKSRLMALNDQINEHLLLILSSKQDTIYIDHWKKEVLNWLTNIYNMKIKAKGNPSVSQKLYLYYLWEGPFGDHAETSVTDMLNQLYQTKAGVVRNDLSVIEIAQKLEQFHKQAAIVIETHGNLDSLFNF